MGSSQSKGGGWKGTIYFDPHADESSGATYTMTAPELKRKFEEVTETQEDILSVSIYKVPLYDEQPKMAMAIFYHAYVVYETDSYWWSIEQNAEGLTIQRSKTIEPVRRWYRQELRRGSPDLLIQDSGKKTMEDVANFLYSKDFLNKPYSLTANNCKDFAKAFFDEVGNVLVLTRRVRPR